MKNIFVIAKINFIETVRDRIFHAIVGFGVLFIALDLFLADISLGDMVMVKSFGLAGVYLFGIIVTIFLGASIVNKEIERRTLYFVLSKPVSYRDIIVGKFAGLYAAVATTTMVMALVYLGVIYYEGGVIDLGGLAAIGFQLFEMMFLVGLLIFLSTIATPLTATLVAALALFTGHFLSTALQNAERMASSVLWFIRGAYYTFPNLEKFNIRNMVVHDIFPSAETTLFALLYAVAYTALLLIAAHYFLKKKEL